MFFDGLTSHDICVLKTYTMQNLRHEYVPFFDDFSFVFSCDNQSGTVTFKKFKSFYQNRYENYIVPKFKNNLLKSFIYTTPVYLIYFLILLLLGRAHLKSTKEKFIRGAVQKDEDEISSILQSFDESEKFWLNEKICIPESIVTRHNFVVGKPGSGKSNLINRVIEQLVKRDIKCIIHDFKGDFIPQFYNPQKHYIFNPLDQRHMALLDDDSQIKGWTIFNDLNTYPDLDAFCAALIPETKSSDPIFYTAPRDLLRSSLIYCIKNDKKTNKDLYDTILLSPEEQKEIFAQLPDCRIALKHLEDKKLSSQFSAIISTFTDPIRYLVESDGNFSIEKWVSDPNPEKNIIFISNHAKVRTSLQKLIATFFDFSITSLNSLPDDKDRRLYLILDEIGRLGKIDSIIDFLTVSRSKGGAAFILIQDFNQLVHIYGREKAETIISNCGNKFFFAVGNDSSAEFVSKELATVEVERTRESKSFGVSDLKDSIGINKEIVEKKIALTSEILNLPTFNFFMRLTDLPLTHVKMELKIYPYNEEPFVSKKLSIDTSDTRNSHVPKEPASPSLEIASLNVSDAGVSVDKNDLENSCDEVWLT